MGHPGWYNDPNDPNAARWFDGTRWTDHVVLKADWRGRGKPPPPVEGPAAPKQERPFDEPAPSRKRRTLVITGLTALIVLAGAVIVRRQNADDHSKFSLNANQSHSVALADGVDLIAAENTLGGATTVSVEAAPKSVAASRTPTWFVPAGAARQIDISPRPKTNLTLRFTPPEGETRVPVILRFDTKLGWYPVAVGAAGRPAVSKRTLFSPFWFGWIEKVASTSRQALSDRHPALTCSGPPTWVEFSPPSQDVVHACATTNREGSTERVEIQVRNNRGIALEVGVPKGVAYAHVEGQPEPMRLAVRQLTGHDSVLLPPGGLMSVGFAKRPIGAVVPMPVNISSVGIVYTLLEEAYGADKDSLYGVMASIGACSPKLTPGPIGTRPGPDALVAATGQIVGCAKDLLGNEKTVATLARTQRPNASANDVDKLQGALRLAGRWLAGLIVGSKTVDVLADIYAQETVRDINSMSPVIAFKRDKQQARPTNCQTIRFAREAPPVQVRIVRGSVECEEAEDVLSRYLTGGTDTRPEGSGAFADVGAWHCGSPTIGEVESTGRQAFCDRPDNSRIEAWEEKSSTGAASKRDGAFYNSFAEFKENAMQAGLPCPGYEAAVHKYENGGRSFDCTYDSVIAWFPNTAALDAEKRCWVGQGDSKKAILVGPNWAINARKSDIEKVVASLGGEILPDRVYEDGSCGAEER